MGVGGWISRARSSPSSPSSSTLLLSGGRGDGRRRGGGAASPTIRPSSSLFVIWFGCAGAATKSQISGSSDLIHGGWAKEDEDLKMAAAISSCGPSESAIIYACVPGSVAGSSGLTAGQVLRRGFGMPVLLLQALLPCFSSRFQVSWRR